MRRDVEFGWKSGPASQPTGLAISPNMADNTKCISQIRELIQENSFLFPSSSIGIPHNFFFLNSNQSFFVMFRTAREISKNSASHSIDRKANNTDIHKNTTEVAAVLISFDK